MRCQPHLGWITKLSYHMKKLFFIISLVLLCGMQLYAQESSVKILLNEEERFRFDGPRLEFFNPGHHILIGDSAGYHMDNAAVHNTFIGHLAGYHNTTGWENVFIGDSTGYSNTDGNENVFVGNWTGYSNTGNSNVFIGTYAGVYNTTGYRNTFVGPTSGASNTTGFRNTFLGLSSGAYNTTGSYNTYLGRVAGYNNQEGDSNVFIGNGAGFNEMGSNRLYIANSNTIAPLIYGEFDNNLLKLNGEVRVVDHDVYVTDPTKGIILKSPNGSCWRLKVSNNGTLITEAIDPCP